jgi:ABC-type transport system involved in multi-copper enzyme maturation permease subunit
MNIVQLIKLEWLKFHKNKLFIAALISYAVLLPGMMSVVLSIDQLPPPLPQPKSLFNTPDIWSYLGYTGNWIAYFVMGFLGLYMVSLEFSTKTLRQGIINGLSRKELWVGKVGFMVLLAIAATLYYMLSGFALGMLGTEPFEGSPVLGESYIILRYFIMILGYLTFGFMLGLLIRGIGIASMLYFMYVFFLEVMIRYLIHLKIFEHRSMIFYPMNALEDLTPFPVGGSGQMVNNMNLGFELFMTPAEATITSLVYIGLFLFASFLLLTKKDL